MFSWVGVRGVSEVPGGHPQSGSFTAGTTPGTSSPPARADKSTTIGMRGGTSEFSSSIGTSAGMPETTATTSTYSRLRTRPGEIAGAVSTRDEDRGVRVVLLVVLLLAEQ